MSILENAKNAGLGVAGGNANGVFTIESGEELLHSIAPKLSTTGEEKVLVAGVDGGSTQTRVILFDFEDEEMLDNKYVIPSKSVVYDDTTSVIKTDDMIYDNMDSLIINLNPGDLTIGGRILRGTKLQNVPSSRQKLSGAINKIEQSVFYNNIIDGIGYSIVLDAVQRNQVINKKYKIVLGASLPPDAAHAETSINKFKRRIMSEFKWSNADLGVSFSIEIVFVATQTEPEAVIKAFAAQNPDKNLGNCVLLIEGGGSTFGTEVLKNNRSSRQLSRTFKFGGSAMHKLFVDAYRDKTGRDISIEAAKKAIETGILTTNRDTVEVEDIVVSVKTKLADRVVDEVREKLFEDQLDFTMDDITNIVYSGRSFNSAEHSPSLSNYVSVRFEKILEGCEYDRIDECLVPLGNLLNAWLDAEESGVFSDSEE